MGYTLYRETVEVFDGFGTAQIDIGTVGTMNSVSVVDSSGEALPRDSIINFYDGALELDGPIGGSLLWQHNQLGWSGFQNLFAESSNTKLTVAIKTAKKRLTAHIGVVIYR